MQNHDFEADVVTSEVLLLTIPQVMKILRLGRTKIYQLIDKEDFPVVRFGRAVRVPQASLQEWLKQREEHKKS